MAARIDVVSRYERIVDRYAVTGHLRSGASFYSDRLAS